MFIHLIHLLKCVYTPPTICAIQLINFLVNGICKNSFGPCAFVFGPSTPVTIN